MLAMSDLSNGLLKQNNNLIYPLSLNMYLSIQKTNDKVTLGVSWAATASKNDVSPALLA